MLGFREVKRHEPNGRLEFAAMEATSAAKLMLARVDEVPAWDPGGHMVAELFEGSIGSEPPSG